VIIKTQRGAMDKRTVIHFPIATVLIVGAALLLSETPLDAGLIRDALALAFVITLLSLQAWVRRRFYPPKRPDAAGPASRRPRRPPVAPAGALPHGQVM
jgi:hypothetical protein